MPLDISKIKSTDNRTNVGTRNTITSMPRVNWQPNRHEALKNQREALKKMHYMLDVNKLLLGGSNDYRFLTIAVEETLAYCDSLSDFVDGKTEKKDGVSYEGLAAMLNFLAGEAHSYLKYKAEDSDAEHLTVNEFNRILTAKTIHKLATENAADLNKTLDTDREKDLLGEKNKKGVFIAGKNNFDAQYTLLDDAERELKATVSALHGSSDYFKKMMTRLTNVRASLSELKEDAGNQAKFEDYADSLIKLQRDINLYLRYKRHNNDFGTTSLNRIRMAGALKASVDQLVNAQESFRAEKWFESLTQVMHKKHMDFTIPSTVCSVLIVDGKSKNIKIYNELDDAENRLYEVGDAEPVIKNIKALSSSGRMAFARVGKNGAQLNPYNNTENPADWIEREFPKSADDFTPEHKMHLYNMARQNRLFVFRNDLSYDDIKYDHITMDKKGGCIINDYYEMNKDREGFDKQGYDKNFTSEQKKVTSKACDYKSDFILVSSYMNKFKSSNKLSDKQKIELQKNHENLGTFFHLNIMARYFPEWLKDKNTVHELCEYARILEATHTQTDEEKIFLEKRTYEPGLLMQEDYLKLCKKFLAMIGATSFDDLLNKKILIDGKEIKVEKGYILAAHIIKTLNAQKIVQVDDKKIIYGDKLTELKPVTPEESRVTDEYMTRLEELSKKATKQLLPSTVKNSHNFDNYEQFEKLVKNDTLLREELSNAGLKDAALDAHSFSISNIAKIRKTIKSKQESMIPVSFSEISDNLGNLAPDKQPYLTNRNKNNPNIDETLLKKMCVLIEFHDLYHFMKMKLDKQEPSKILKCRIAAQILTDYAEKVIKETNVADNAALSKENKAEREKAIRLIMVPAERDAVAKELIEKVKCNITLEAGQNPLDVKINKHTEINEDLKKIIAECDEKFIASKNLAKEEKNKKIEAAVNIH